MAWNPVPTTLFAGWTQDGTNITLPIANVPELTSAEANATTGDTRKILFALCEKIANWWYALATADRPTKMTVTRSISVDSVTGIATKSYTLTFKVGTLTQEIVSES
jgi:hypothetical protein